MNVFCSDLITMVPKWNYFIFMQIDYPRWPPGTVTKYSINTKMTISYEPLVEIDPSLCQNVSCMNPLYFFCSLGSPAPCTPPPPPKKKKKKKQIWILCQNSLTRELKIRVVGFVLKKFLTYFEMLIVPHALQCVDGCFLVFYRI